MQRLIKMAISDRQVRLILFGGKKEIPLLRISPQVERIFVTAAYIGLTFVFVFSVEATHLKERIEHKNNQIEKLQTQIDELLALKETVAELEKKEAELKTYFGLEKYSTLEPFGIGGAKAGKNQVGMHLSLASSDIDWKAWHKHSAERIELKIHELIANYETFQYLKRQQNEIERYTPNIAPVATDHPRVTSHFGWRKNPLTYERELHSGIDIAGPAGTHIIAPADGVVITRGYDQWLGKYMVVQHTPEIKTIYGHLDKVLLPKGKTVKRRQPIALMGNTGMSTSRHLHYTVTRGGRAVDPMQFILDLENP